MPLLTLDNVSLAFGHVALLDRTSWVIEPGDKLGLIGRNGAGKSSLLKLLAEDIQADDGLIWRQPGLRLAYVAQEPDLTVEHTIYQAVAQGLGDVCQLLLDYHAVTMQMAEPDADFAALMDKMQSMQFALEAQDGWRLQAKVEAVLTRLGLHAEAQISTLSGGVKKRVALARALVSEPDLLLLDEPTNHLDLAAIEWLETLIREFVGAVVVITHDRRFLDNVSKKIIELDRGRLRCFDGTFSIYRQHKAEQLAIEDVEQAKFDKFLAQEEVWIRKGVQARRTRNEGRVLRLEMLRNLRSERRNHIGQVNLTLDSGNKSGKRVAELTQVSKSFDGRQVIANFSAKIQRGDKVGLIGPNGIGKTTLIKLILGQIAPDQGQVELGSQLSVAYFDQFRDQLDEEATVIDVISQGGDYVEIGGQRKHVISYLEDFLFAPARARSPVKSLSGGERNRLLLARLFTRPANVLVLDEPTNDLDIDTLELLEELLQDYPGTVLLVSHDREFLDQIVTQVIAFEGDGQLREYVGGYDDWLVQRARSVGHATSASDKTAVVSPAPIKPVKKPTPKKSTTGVRKPHFTEDQLLLMIEDLEIDQAMLTAQLSGADLFRGDLAQQQKLQSELDGVGSQLASALAQWEALG